MARENLYCPKCDGLVEMPETHEAYQRVCAGHPDVQLWPSKTMFERDQAVKDDAARAAEPTPEKPVVSVIFGNANQGSAPTQENAENPTNIGENERAGSDADSGGAAEEKEGFFAKLKDKISGGAAEE